ncbi:hypothetical protein JW921_10415 [Candidatus Fermentibacterales bacterium]|nr:hypothetical protein [Candidatus Fermentibacterales bacterium]
MAVALILIAVCHAELEMVNLDDSIFASWTNGNSTFVGIWDGSFETVRRMGDYHSSVGLMETDSGYSLLYAGRDDDANGYFIDFCLLDTDDLTTVDSIRVYAEDMIYSPMPPAVYLFYVYLLRHTDGLNRVFFNCEPSTWGSYGYMNVVAGEVQYDSQDGLVIADTLHLEYEEWYIDNFPLTEPATDASGVPMCLVTMQGYYGGFSAEDILSISHRPAARASTMDDYMLYSYSGPPPGCVLANGSCSGNVLAIWEAVGPYQQRYSVFQSGDPEPLYTEVLPFDLPQDSHYSMSRDRGDSGLLLAWRQGSGIRVRHWEGEWNDYPHVVASGVATLRYKGLEVSSVPDGYWIGYYEESSEYPEFCFVPRDSVTGISEESGPEAGASPSVCPNPCSSFGSALFTGLPPDAEAAIVDLSGRLVRHMVASDSGAMEWDLREDSGLRCSAGIYFVVTEGAGHPLLRLVIL